MFTANNADHAALYATWRLTLKNDTQGVYQGSIKGLSRVYPRHAEHEESYKSLPKHNQEQKIDFLGLTVFLVAQLVPLKVSFIYGYNVN